MNKVTRLLLKALSTADEGLDLEKSRKLMDIKILDPLKRFYRTLDYKFYSQGHEVPARIYFPIQEAYETFDIEAYRIAHSDIDMGAMLDNTYPVILYIHGGGFVTESVNSYNKVCWNLAKNMQQVVISVDYPLAPEYRYPRQLEDCYAVAKEIFTKRSILNVDPEDITLMGDSAGGNLTAALCQMARDRGEFSPSRQILIYPCVSNDYSEQTPYRSVLENGTDYLLTRRIMADYLDLYQSSPKDRKDPYFAPILAKDFSSLPRALVITAEFDPLRDEGEDYANRMREAGVDVTLYRISDTIHGYMLMSPLYPAVQQTYQYMKEFLYQTSDINLEESQDNCDR